MRRDPVVLAWAVGIGIAVLAYAVGTQDFLVRVGDWLHEAAWQIGDAVEQLSHAGREAVRALAIGLYATFVLLSLAAIRRTGRGRGMLFWVSVVFLLLIGRGEFVVESNARWLLALLVTGVGSLSMTQRLRQGVIGRPYQAASR